MPKLITLKTPSLRGLNRIFKSPALLLSYYSNKQLIFSSLGIVILASVVFGLWFKVKQISIASEKIIALYPLTAYAVSSLKTLFIFSSIWLGLVLLNSKIRGDLNRTALARNFFLSSLPFSAFLLSSLNIGFSIQALLFILFCSILLFFNFKNTCFWKLAKEPAYTLLFYLLIFFLILKSHSPLYHNFFWDTYGINYPLVNLEHVWENAKAYDFLGNFTQSGYLGGYSQAICCVSELLGPGRSLARILSIVASFP